MLMVMMMLMLVMVRCAMMNSMIYGPGVKPPKYSLYTVDGFGADCSESALEAIRVDIIKIEDILVLL